MKQVLLIALALSCAYASQVEAFSFGFGDWFGTLINRAILSVVLAFYSAFAVLFAVIGQPLWFSTNAWTAVSNTFKLPAFDQFSSLSTASSYTTQ